MAPKATPGENVDFGRLESVIAAIERGDVLSPSISDADAARIIAARRPTMSPDEAAVWAARVADGMGVIDDYAVTH